jgi:preprotein translocase subunit YajC
MFESPANAQAAAGGGLESLQSFLPLVLIFVVFYFLLIRPQQKRAKQHKTMVDALRRGDRVVVAGALIGTVAKVVSDTELSVEIAEGVRVRVVRAAITEVPSKTEPVAGSKDAAEPADKPDEK